jgi:hypothetical protein
MSTQTGFLRHLVPTMFLGLAAAFAPSAAQAIDPSYSGSWYRPSESGSGFNLEIFEDDRALLFWYTYTDDGQPVWLYSEGIIDGEAIDFDVWYADGMRFSDLDTADKVNRPWGSLLMEFTDCNTATISYDSTLTGVPNSPEGTRAVPVQRLVSIASLPCRRQAAGYWKGEHFDPTLGVDGMWADLSGVLTEDGKLFFSSDDSEEVFLGTYHVNGSTLVFNYRICPNGGGACVDATGSSTYASRDFATGQGTSAQWGTQPFNLYYSTVYDRTPTLASLAGTWGLTDAGVVYTVNVTAAGVVSGSDSRGCTYSGQLAAVDEDFNAFSFTGNIGGCTAEGWTGMVVNTDAVNAGDRDALEFRIEGEGNAYAFTLTRS